MNVRPPRESIEKCKDKRYKKRNKQVQKRLAPLEMAEDESDWEYEGEPIPDGDALGELHGEALAQAEHAAAARPGLAVRMGDVIERLFANAQPRDGLQPAQPPDQGDGAEHYEGEPAESGRVWHCINGEWVQGVQESLSIFAPQRDPDVSLPESEGQASPSERLTHEAEESDEPAPKRLAIERASSPFPIPIPLSSENSNRAGPSGYHPPDESIERRARSVRRILYSSDEEDAEAASAQLIAEQEAARRREKRLQARRAALQFIDSMAAVDDEDESDPEPDSDSTDSDDSFIVGDDVCD